MGMIGGHSVTVSFGGNRLSIAASWQIDRWAACPRCNGSGEANQLDYRPGDYLRLDACGVCGGCGQVDIARLDFSRAFTAEVAARMARALVRELTSDAKPR